MNTLSNLEPVVDQGKKRLGRGYGSGKGAKSGRGTTRHQKARTKIPLHFEGGQNRMVKKYPLLRGKGRNKSIVEKPVLITLDDLNSFKKNSTITIESLVEQGIIDKSEVKRGAKVVANGSITISVTVELPVSQTAREAIEKAGGSVS